MSGPTLATDDVSVSHVPVSSGELVEFIGSDAPHVLARALSFWMLADTWLRGGRPEVSRTPDGRYVATVRLWSAE